MSSKIYTKTGDDGTSKTMSGDRKDKSNLEFEVLGHIDELNASLGILVSIGNKKLTDAIIPIQNDLFQISSYFAGYPYKPVDAKWLLYRTEQLEILIDEIDPLNKPLTNFILPGGSKESAYLHLSRTICRRTERVMVKLLEYQKDYLNLANSVSYLNRLSDYMFVLARFYNENGKKDIIWKEMS